MFSASTRTGLQVKLSTEVSSGCGGTVSAAAAAETVASCLRLEASVFSAVAAFLSWLQCSWPETEH